MKTMREIFYGNSKTVKKAGASIMLLLLILGGAAGTAVFAQTTDFTYQGKLADTGTSLAAYDFEFRLCDSNSADCSTPLDSNLRPSVAVSNGIFTVTLNFGASNFNGADRFLEIRLKRPNDANYTTLAPRQKLTSAPYAIQTRNAENANQLSGFTANQFVLDNDTRLNPNNYVQNTTAAQSGGNFNIGGTGTANVLNAATQFNLNGSRILSSTATGNLFVGLNAGAVNNGGGNFNSFFGSSAGSSNTSGISNSFFGNSAGISTVTGGSNSFFGLSAGANTNTGSNNTAIGARATSGGGTLTNTTAIGANALVTQDNSLTLGSISGVNGATADTRVGIGTTAPAFKLEIIDPSNTGLRVRTNTAGGTVASFAANGAFQIDTVSVAGGRMTILEDGKVGFGTNNPTSNFELAGRFLTLRSASPVLELINTAASNKRSYVTNSSGDLEFYTNGNPNLIMKSDGHTGIVSDTGGQFNICGFTPAGSTFDTLARCSSSLRYKTDLQPYAGGMDLVKRLQPITFRWKSNNVLDLGFGAEPVSEIDPLLVTYNSKGEVEGVKYDRLSTVFVNAFKEQQTQIETQAAQIKRQQEEIDQLKKLVCATMPQAEICQEKKDEK